MNLDSMGEMCFSCMHVSVYVVVMHAFPWLWLSFMRSFYVVGVIMQYVDIMI